MDALLAAVSRGQTRVRVRAAVLGVGAALLLLSLGGWRLAAGRHVSCAVPRDRLAAVWLPGDEANPRRQAIHRAFAASGRPTAETVWQRVAKALDDYTTQWSAMHVQTCEATHVRGEQSGEVLDLRMGCLTDTLDGVRALTDVLCARGRRDDLPGRDGRIEPDAAEPVRGHPRASIGRSAAARRDDGADRRFLRRSLRDATALEEVGNDRAALKAAREILPQAEATGYKPLIAEVLFLIGVMQMRIGTGMRPNRPRESPLHGGGVTRRHHRREGRCSSLAAVVGYSQDRRARVGPMGEPRARDPRPAGVAAATDSRVAAPQSGSLTAASGRATPPAARPCSNRRWRSRKRSSAGIIPTSAERPARWHGSLTELGRPEEALRSRTRALEILRAAGSGRHRSWRTRSTIEARR